MTVYRLGVLGYPLEHSLSPALHEHFMKVAGVQGSYKKLEVSPGEFTTWFEHWKTHHLHGFSVTIPYKVQVIPFLKHVSEEAGLVGAVNTVIVRADGLYGENTDVYGFMAPIPETVRTSLQGGHAVIIGTGGASRAVAYALMSMGIARLTFLTRNPERALPTLNIAHGINRFCCKGSVIVDVQTELTPELVQSIVCLVNASPVGMMPHEEQCPIREDLIPLFFKEPYIYDLVYNPTETRLIQLAKTAGLTTQHGLSMLIHQGARAFELWTGETLTEETLDIVSQAFLHEFQIKHF